MAKASVKETQFAVYFLQKLGASLANPYLITAVVAWLRKESGGLNSVIGNNPFNIRDSKYASGYRQTKNHNGHFALFKDLKTGAIATAALLLGAGNDYRGYGMIVKAAIRDGGSTDADKQKQALDFLAYIALSKWDSGHYGEGKDVTSATYDPAKNGIVAVWAGITGLPSLPPEPQSPEHHKIKVSPPPPLNPPTRGDVTYIDPYEAKGFYDASRVGGDMGNLTRV